MFCGSNQPEMILEESIFDALKRPFNLNTGTVGCTSFRAVIQSERKIRVKENDGAGENIPYQRDNRK